MDRKSRVQNERRNIAQRAFQRWQGAQAPMEAMPRRAQAAGGAAPSAAIAMPTPAQRERFQEREFRRQTFDSSSYREIRSFSERQIGATLDFASLPPNEQALKAGRPVVRIVALNGPGMVAEGFASGFLVAPDLVLTNYHVFRDAGEARGTGAQFLHERTQGGLRQGVTFALKPDRFFINHRGLDYALVALEATGIGGEPLSQFQFLPLIAVTGKILKGDPVNIIQHPNGGPKQYATVNNRLLDLRDDGFLLYETDTLEGSSGSPVFNQHWETIALHHCGVPRMEGDMLVTRDGRRVPLHEEVADSDIEWVANEGVRISALVASLADQRLDKPEQQRVLEALLATTRDPLRIVDELSPLTGPAIPEKVMAQNVFQFSGPVTIHAAASPPAAPSAAVIPSVPPPATAQPEFREKKLRFDENYTSRNSRGYRDDFLSGWAAPAPKLADEALPDALKKDGKPWVIPYYHYSLVMNEKRRLLYWAAANVNYSKAARRYTRTRKEYGGEDWRLDPRVAIDAPGVQLEDAHFYAPAKKIDRGHIVRREDSAWGSTIKEAEYGNSDTYHWTNCTPQSEAFNQSGKSGIWGQFEEHIQTQVKAVGNRMSVFAGPVLNPEDPEHGYDEGEGATIQVPMEYWKLVLCVGEDGNGQKRRYAYGFVFDQTDAIERLGYERMNMDDYEIYQTPIKEIQRKTGLRFDAGILEADVMAGGGADESIRGFAGKRIRSLSGVILR